MSFFDDGDPPTRRRTTARPPARPRQPDAAARPSSLAPPDAETRRNRLIGLGAGLLIFVILMGLLVSSCRSSARDRALRNYNREVTALVETSSANSQQLFDALNRQSGSADDTTIQQIRVEAEDVAKRARNLDVRDEMKPAQRNLLLTLNLRAGAIGEIARLLPEAQGNDQAASLAVRKIAGQMRAFLASDVVYSQRVQPLITEAFKKADIGGQTVAGSAFLASDGWLSSRQVADRINPDALAGSRGSSTPAPGTHGHNLVSTKVAGTTLSTSAPTRVQITSGARPAIDITFANSGENDESDVIVSMKVTIAGRSSTVRKTVNITRTGQEATVRAAFPQAVQVGQAAQLDVSVAKVPNEENVTNNRATYSVQFVQ